MNFPGKKKNLCFHNFLANSFPIWLQYLNLTTCLQHLACRYNFFFVSEHSSKERLYQIILLNTGELRCREIKGYVEVRSPSSIALCLVLFISVHVSCIYIQWTFLFFLCSWLLKTGFLNEPENYTCKSQRPGIGNI